MMNLRMLTLVALMAFIPLNTSADGCPLPDCVPNEGCLLNGVKVLIYPDEPDEPFEPVEIEGTNSGDDIDCRCSTQRHDIYGSGGGDTICGSPYDDFIAGGGGADTIHGGDGNDAIDGGANDDFLYGDGGNDVIFGGVGSAPASGVGCDLVFEPGSSDLLKGGSGDDVIHGGEGHDCIDAGSGEDVIYGEDGNDTLEGGNHNDMLDGGLGFDHIDGGWHTDTCIDFDPIEDTENGAEFSSCELTPDSAPFCGDGMCDIEVDSCSCAEDCSGFPGCGGSCDLVPAGSLCVLDSLPGRRR